MDGLQYPVNNLKILHCFLHSIYYLSNYPAFHHLGKQLSSAFYIKYKITKIKLNSYLIFISIFVSLPQIFKKIVSIWLSMPNFEGENVG